MRYQFLALVLIASAYDTIALNLDRRAGDEPCAQVSAMVAWLRAANPKVSPSIPGELAFNCLQSVPLHQAEALSVTKALLPYVEFQSDLSYKAAPPAGYPYAAIDLMGSVTTIANKLQNNSYPNEYAWQMEIFQTFMAAKDGHFRFAGDLLAKPVRFTRNVSLVSVSMDGVSMPQIYLTDEILNANATFKPSAVAQINGQEAIAFMQAEADKGFQQDPDAAFNTVMFNPALDFTPGLTVRGFFAGDGRYGFFYPGPNTTLNFANGSTAVFQTQARVLGNFTGVTDGQSAFQRFCVPQAATQQAGLGPGIGTFKPSDAVNNTARLKGYPMAQVSSSDGQISSYYLSSPGNSDVGVLSMNSFEPNTPAEFQAVIQTTLAEMKRDGRTKLIVDLQGNGGGIIVNGYDAFRQLFPQTQDTLFARQRIGPVYQTLAQLTSDRFGNFSAATSSDIDAINQAESHFNVNFDISQNRSRFTTFAEKFGPVSVNGDLMSNLQQADWDDPNFTINETTGAGMDITGYGTRKNFTQQPFPAENIVMLYDGTCASTCTLFSEMMRNLGGVKSIALGGRPSSTQIQAIGGVKGAQSLSFAGLASFPVLFLNSTASPDVTAAQKSILLQLSDLPTNRSVDNGINFSDQILQANVQDGLPAQYVREDANCRAFYTPAMIRNVTAMWDAAADVAFRGKACVVGGISQGMVSARSGPYTKAQVVEMEKDATDARALLRAVRLKALMQPVERMAGWKGLHGRAIPNMYMV